MATKRSSGATTAPKKMTLAQYRDENEKLKEKLSILEDSAFCPMCGKFKKKDKFYVNSDPLIKSGTSFICKQCAYDIAERVDKNGKRNEPTKESLIKALEYLDKPFLENVYNASIQESENLISGRVKTNFARSYMKNIQMVNYLEMRFKDSDFFYNAREDIKNKVENDEEYLRNIDVGTYEQYERDKKDVVRLLGYDPFEKESIEDQPFLYSQLLGMLDSDENANDDMLRTSSIITIVRSFLQSQKIDDTISKLMSEYQNIEKNAASIKSLQESKKKLQEIITNLAAESCISLKNSKNAKKGENTWTGKLKKLKDLNLREYEINGYDIETCKGMQQVSDISVHSIIEQLKLDESEYSDMVAEQTKKIVDLERKTNGYEEAVRILLRENLDLRDVLKNNHYNINNELIDLNEFVNNYMIDNKEDS